MTILLRCGEICFNRFMHIPFLITTVKNYEICLIFHWVQNNFNWNHRKLSFFRYNKTELNLLRMFRPNSCIKTLTDPYSQKLWEYFGEIRFIISWMVPKVWCVKTVQFLGYPVQTTKNKNTDSAAHRRCRLRRSRRPQHSPLSSSITPILSFQA